MTFAEKLVFLMNLTSTSNKQLAEAVNVDASLISRLRNARRGAPRNLAYARGMAAYFAKKCEGNYQRGALSETMGRKHLPAHTDAGHLASVLFDWLTDSRDQVGQFLNTFERFSLVEPAHAPPERLAPPQGESKCFVYYGNEGKRGAVSAFVSHLMSMEPKGTVLLSTDERMDWLREEPGFHAQLQAQMLRLLKSGFRIRRVGAPLNTADEAFDALSRWLPLYMTGQVEAFYYPRLRDELYRRTWIVLPGVAAVTASSTGDRAVGRATLLTFDQRLTNAFAGDFEDMLAKCKPMMTTYSTVHSAEALLRCISQFESDRGDRVQRSTTLSSITSPLSLIRQTASSAPPEEAEAIVRALTQAQAMFEQSLAHYEVIDIHTLATSAQVRAGNVPMGTAYLSAPAYYTPERYALHLQNILHYLETYKNYHAVLLPDGGEATPLMVKEGRQALLLRPGAPLVVFEVSQPNIAEACRDYLLRLAQSPLSPEQRRRDAILQIRQAIQALGEH